jgi:protein required for attachment to host cells
MPNIPDMGQISIAPEAWVVVCDGRKWLILENKGDRAHVNLVTRDEHEENAAATRQQGTDRPGRLHPSVGMKRGAVEQTDWHDQAETALLRKLSQRLDQLSQENAVPAIVLVAPPRALGTLRSLLSPQVIKLVVAQVDKDYVRLPVDQIEKRLRQL